MSTIKTYSDPERQDKPSASGFDRIAHCPGSIEAERGLPQLPEQQVTADGVAIHEALESGFDEELNMTQAEIADKLRKMEERELVNWLDHYNIMEAHSYSPVVLRETRFWIRDTITLDPIASAKPDVVYHAGDYGFIVNFKAGFKKPTASELSWQSRIEVLAFWHERMERSQSVKAIRGAFAASRLSSHFDSTDYTLDDLLRIEREFRHILWRSEQRNAPRVPGVHCRYCRAQAYCREAATYALVVASRVPVLADGGKQSLAIAQAVHRMTPAELAHVHERESLVKAMFDAVEARMKALPKEELASIGYALVPGNKNKKVTDPATAFARLETLLSPQERIQCISIGRGKAAVLVAAKENISSAAAKEKVDAAIGDAMIEVPGNPKLKPL